MPKLTARAAIVALAPLLAMGVLPAAAASFDSAYSDLDIGQCTTIHSDDFGSVWACPGYKGMPVRIAEGDLRFLVSYGLESAHEKAAEQSLPPFNSLGGKIEWRLSNREGQWKPVATILRFFVDKGQGSDDPKAMGQVLVVTQVKPGATCHMAYIDALANADANDMAHKVADEQAGSFDCAKEPEIVGKFEAWQQ
jgi:hypothetical protein